MEKLKMDASMMKAITYSEFGMSTDVLKLRELPVPKADKGEVLVSLEFSGSNPSDAKSRAANRPGITKPQFEQIVPNSDGSGIITAVGEAVDKSRIGQRVWIWNGQWQRPNGTAVCFIEKTHLSLSFMLTSSLYKTNKRMFFIILERS